MDFMKIDDIVEIKPTFQLKSKHDRAPETYKIYAIVHHYGTKSNGHYIA